VPQIGPEPLPQVFDGRPEHAKVKSDADAVYDLNPAFVIQHISVAEGTLSLSLLETSADSESAPGMGTERGRPLTGLFCRLVSLNIIGDNCGASIRMIETTYAKLLVGKRREFIERGPWTVEQVRDGVREVTLGRGCGRVGPCVAHLKVLMV
jgi:hypothetical protein